jgi:type VI secretion system protein ImpG
VRGEVLTYRTCHEAELWPLAVERARLSGLPLVAPVNPMAPGAAGVLRLSLATTVAELNFADLGLGKLRFHLRAADSLAIRLLELLCTSTVSIALANGPNDPRPTVLPREALSHVGFEREEAALPWPQRAFAGQRLLTEYFAFPGKFLYLELSGLEARTLVQRSGNLEIFIYLSRSPGDLERSVSEEHFVLGAVPAVNLFAQAAEPIAMDGTQSEWRVVPDARRPAALEVYSVEKVRFSRPEEPMPKVVQHFQHLRQQDLDDQVAVEDMSWLATRRQAPSILGGTETLLALRNPQFDAHEPADGVLSVDTLCCNRDLPSLLPYGGGQPVMKVTDPAAPTGGVDCLSPPTATLRPALRERSGWQLVSHLALNHLSVTGGEDAARALREMLRLHDLRHTAETALALDGLVSVEAKPGMARLPGARPASYARGLDVVLTFEPQAWTAGGLYLLAAVLERYFALQVSINGFVRTSVHLRGRSGAVASWPPRSGTRVLL